MLARLLYRILDLLPHDTIVVAGEPYMHRWYLVGYAPGDPDATFERANNSRPGRWWNLPFAARIHCIVASDDDRAFHDHPWPFVSIGLAGSYVEVTPAWADPWGGRFRCAAAVDNLRNGRRRLRAPFVNRKAATDLHLLEVEHGPVWTLFLTGRKQRTWGFATPAGWVPWREFNTADDFVSS